MKSLPPGGIANGFKVGVILKPARKCRLGLWEDGKGGRKGKGFLFEGLWETEGADRGPLTAVGLLRIWGQEGGTRRPPYKNTENMAFWCGRMKS